VTAPPAAQIFGIGETVEVAWVSAGCAGEVKIDLYRTNNVIEQLTTMDWSITNTAGTYQAKLRNSLALASDYRFKVRKATMRLFIVTASFTILCSFKNLNHH